MVLSYLEGPMLLQARAVCCRWKTVASGVPLWEGLCGRTWAELVEELDHARFHRELPMHVPGAPEGIRVWRNIQRLLDKKKQIEGLLVAHLSASTCQVLDHEMLMLLLCPSVELTLTSASDDSLPLGTAKLGGLPDMVHGSMWPKLDGAPLSFLFQVPWAEFAARSCFLRAPPSSTGAHVPSGALLHVFVGNTSLSDVVPCVVLLSSGDSTPMDALATYTYGESTEKNTTPPPPPPPSSPEKLLLKRMKVPSVDAPAAPPCPYDGQCFRRQPKHFVEVTHPKELAKARCTSTVCKQPTEHFKTFAHMPRAFHENYAEAVLQHAGVATKKTPVFTVERASFNDTIVLPSSLSPLVADLSEEISTALYEEYQHFVAAAGDSVVNEEGKAALLEDSRALTGDLPTAGGPYRCLLRIPSSATRVFGQAGTATLILLIPEVDVHVLRFDRVVAVVTGE